MTPPTTERTRDAQRSRQAILEAAEQLFSTRGYEGASLSDIAAVAGLSRGTPSYFFGSKEQLYVAVLDRAFAARQEATRRAFVAVQAWCEGDEGLDGLRAALRRAGEEYLRFLSGRESFVRLILQEELSGGLRMGARTTPSTAMHDAFAAVRAQGRRRGIGDFDVDDAILVFVGLTFAPISLHNTLMRTVRRDLAGPAARRRQAELAVAQLMPLLSA